MRRSPILWIMLVLALSASGSAQQRAPRAPEARVIRVYGFGNSSCGAWLARPERGQRRASGTWLRRLGRGSCRPTNALDPAPGERHIFKTDQAGMKALVDVLPEHPTVPFVNAADESIANQGGKTR